MSAKRILFVCTGNSCRSVMAEGLMDHMLRRAGIGAVVESAGVFAMEGMSPTRETLRVLQEQIGVDCAAHRARVLTPDIVQQADLILAMEEFQVEEILRRAPAGKGKVHLLKSYGLPPGDIILTPNIPDPIGKPMEVYEVCFTEIREAVERLAKLLGAANV